MNFKKLLVPSGKTEVSAVKMWEVRWISLESRYPEHPNLVQSKPECEVFTSLEEATLFKEACIDAFKLLKQVGPHTEVILNNRT